jgi:23S rRNA pseudouridine1911/1915/1917 synthase
MEKIKVEQSQNNTRLDKYLNEKMDQSRSAIQAMIEGGSILVNGNMVKNKYKVKTDDEITIEELEEKEIEILPEDLPITIV